MIPEDTSPAAKQILIEGYRNMSPARKLQRVFDLSESLRELARQRIIRRHGGTLSEREIRLKIASLFLDRQLMIAAFNYDPDKECY